MVEDDIGNTTSLVTGLSRCLHHRRAAHAAPTHRTTPQRSNNHPPTSPPPALATSENTRFMQPSQSCQTLYVGPPPEESAPPRGSAGQTFSRAGPQECGRAPTDRALVARAAPVQSLYGALSRAIRVVLRQVGEELEQARRKALECTYDFWFSPVTVRLWVMATSTQKARRLSSATASGAFHGGRRRHVPGGRRSLRR